MYNASLLNNCQTPDQNDEKKIPYQKQSKSLEKHLENIIRYYIMCTVYNALKSSKISIVPPTFAKFLQQMSR